MARWWPHVTKCELKIQYHLAVANPPAPGPPPPTLPENPLHVPQRSRVVRTKTVSLGCLASVWGGGVVGGGLRWAGVEANMLGMALAIMTRKCWRFCITTKRKQRKRYSARTNHIRMPFAGCRSHLASEKVAQPISTLLLQ
jgi:hypothetical protein